MIISYKTEELRDYFRLPATALVRYGPTIARKLAVRFADLCALQEASGLAALGAQECEFSGAPAIMVPITTDFGIFLVANHPKKKAESLDWSNVTRVKIAKIGSQDEQG